MSCAKTAEPIEMPLGTWTRVGTMKHVLDGVQISTRERVILRGVWPIEKHCKAYDLGWWVKQRPQKWEERS